MKRYNRSSPQYAAKLYRRFTEWASETLEENLTEWEAARALWEMFQDEFGSEAERRRYPNLQERVQKWLMGVPLCGLPSTWEEIDEFYGDILGMPLTDAQQRYLRKTYWSDVSFRLLHMWRDNGIRVKEEK